MIHTIVYSEDPDKMRNRSRRQNLLDVAAHDENHALNGLHGEAFLAARLRVVEPLFASSSMRGWLIIFL